MGGPSGLRGGGPPAQGVGNAFLPFGNTSCQNLPGLGGRKGTSRAWEETVSLLLGHSPPEVQGRQTAARPGVSTPGP